MMRVSDKILLSRKTSFLLANLSEIFTQQRDDDENFIKSLHVKAIELNGNIQKNKILFLISQKTKVGDFHLFIEKFYTRLTTMRKRSSSSRDMKNIKKAGKLIEVIVSVHSHRAVKIEFSTLGKYHHLHFIQFLFEFLNE